MAISIPSNSNLSSACGKKYSLMDDMDIISNGLISGLLRANVVPVDV